METVESRDGNPPAPFASRLAESATKDVTSAIAFLFQSPGGEESAKRFATLFKETIDSLRERLPEEIAKIGKPFHEPDEPATLRYSRPVYRERLETAKRRARRSSSGLWYLYYMLEDRGGKGSPDTVVVLRIRHSAAKPFTLEEEE